MHRAYQPVLPTHNKLLQQRWDETYYNEHRRKVSDARPMVDTKAPQTYMHLHLKLKKLQLEEERLATIERDNRILLEKMSYIMRTRGRVDNRNNYEYKSLNREKRQRELLRVTQENQAILRRIMMRKPEYDHIQWQRDWEQNQQFMDSIAQYPRDWWKMGREKTAGGSEKKHSRKNSSESNGSVSDRSGRGSRSSKSDRSEKDEDDENNEDKEKHEGGRDSARSERREQEREEDKMDEEKEENKEEENKEEENKEEEQQQQDQPQQQEVQQQQQEEQQEVQQQQQEEEEEKSAEKDEKDEEKEKELETN